MRRLRAEDPQRQTPDGAGHPSAVLDKVVEGLVGDPTQIHLDTVDQFAEGVHRDGEAPAGVIQSYQNRVGAGRAEPCDVRPGRGQADGLLLEGQVTVADVVEPAGEGVHRGQRRPFVDRQQPDAVGEVACGLTGQRLTGRVCFLYRRRPETTVGGHSPPPPAAGLLMIPPPVTSGGSTTRAERAARRADGVSEVSATARA